MAKTDCDIHRYSLYQLRSLLLRNPNVRSKQAIVNRIKQLEGQERQKQRNGGQAKSSKLKR